MQLGPRKFCKICSQLSKKTQKIQNEFKKPKNREKIFFKNTEQNYVDYPYIFNNWASNTKYHVRTNNGTLCEIEKNINIDKYMVSNKIPYKELCKICASLKNKKEQFHKDWLTARAEEDFYW